MTNADVIIIGGGAAGLSASVHAAEAGARVLLLEKNEKLGKKIYITGKGRCNLTNACDRNTFFENVVRNPRFLYGAFGRYSNYDVMADLEERGLRLKTERGERVFPESDKASDVTAAWEKRARQAGVRVRLHAEVAEVLAEDGAVTGVRLKSGEVIPARAVIAATGGLSYPSTGSTGDGYRFAKEAGHKVTPPRPSLVPFNVQEACCRTFSGLSLKNVSLLAEAEGEELYYGFGEMLFTHFGVSGPLVLTASCYLDKAAGRAVTLHIDLKPALSADQLMARILRECEAAGAKQKKAVLGKLLPASMVDEVGARAGIDLTGKAAEMPAAERESLATVLKDFTLHVTGTRGFAEAIVTQGGVDVKEISPQTMESKKVSGLYFAGEVLDVDAHTGGFNLQIAWSTGAAAGKAAAAKVGEETTT